MASLFGKWSVIFLLFGKWSVIFLLFGKWSVKYFSILDDSARDLLFLLATFNLDKLIDLLYHAVALYSPQHLH